MKNEFWLTNPNILLDKEKMYQLWPMKTMSFVGKVNALSRLVILLAVIGFVFSENRAFQKRIEELRLKNVPEEEKDDAREMAKSMYSNNTIGQAFYKTSIKSKQSMYSGNSISRTV